MPKRIPRNTIHVIRDGEDYVPTIGKPFDFTKEEIAELDEVAPGSIDMVQKAESDEEGAKVVKKPAGSAAGL